jgi:zinc/manganese transport system substrate-binding protein
VRTTIFGFLALLLLGAGFLAGGTARADERAAPVRVVATIEDLADLVRAIGGERVDVTVLARDGQNLHGVRVKPSHLVAVSKADVFVQVGLSLEHAWVPGLLEAARNSRVQPGGVGFVDAGAGFATIDVPVVLDRSQGADVHPQGNPHVNLSVDGAPHFAARILERLVALEPAHAATFRANHAAWLATYEAARRRWDALAVEFRRVAEHRGQPLAVAEYHREFDYLLRFLGVEVAATLEPKPGVPPSPSHLREVVRVLKERQVAVVVTAPWSNDAVTARVADQVGAAVVELPLVVPSGSTWIASTDRALLALASALGVELPEEALPVEAGAPARGSSR